MTTKTNHDIRNEVSRSYAARIGELVKDGEAVPLATGGCCSPSAEASAPACCAPASTEATTGDACCAPGSAEGESLKLVERLYAQDEVADLPATVTDVAFGCGNPTAIAALLPGQTVLDLGSGGGIDCFLAGKMVGDTGRAIGVDMTPEMVALARGNAKKVDATNVEFRLGEIEQLPVADASVDVIISNCVINLSPEKDRVFAEAFRVLKPGGRLQVSDIVWTRPVPDELRGDMRSWADCVAGAVHIDEYVALIRAAGFAEVSAEAGSDSGAGFVSANVTAVRPG